MGNGLLAKIAVTVVLLVAAVGLWFVSFGVSHGNPFRDVVVFRGRSVCVRLGHR